MTSPALDYMLQRLRGQVSENATLRELERESAGCLVGIKRAAALLGDQVTEKGLRRRYERGTLRCVKLGRKLLVWLPDLADIIDQRAAGK